MCCAVPRILCFFACVSLDAGEGSLLGLQSLHFINSAATLEQKPAPKRHFKSK